jgi:acetyltransferase-like isoleucine patch superfamily enzyme
MIRDDVKIGRGTKIWQPELVNLYGCEIGEDCNIGAFVEIGQGVKIGNRVRIGAHCFIPEGVRIEDDAFIGPGTTFTNDKYPPGTKAEWGKIIVMKDASIGARAVILPNVMIGTGALVGAGSVVIESVKAMAMVVGNPARLIVSQIPRLYQDRRNQIRSAGGGGL